VVTASPFHRRFRHRQTKLTWLGFTRASVGQGSVSLDSLKGGERVAMLGWAYGARFHRRRREPPAAVRHCRQRVGFATVGWEKRGGLGAG
jgi:hypothetical protein